MEQKLILVGDGGVGKTTLGKQLLRSEFDPKYIPTLGVEVFPYEAYNIWDTAGQTKFGGLRSGYYVGGSLAIIMVDATSELSANLINDWYNSLKEVNPRMKIGILMNKMGCTNSVKRNCIRKARTFAQENNALYGEIDMKHFQLELFNRYLQELNN